MKRTSPELIAAAQEPFREVFRAARELLHSRDPLLVRRFQQDAPPHIGEFDAGAFALYGTHAAASAVRGEAYALDVLAGWLRLGEGSSVPIARIDVSRSPVSMEKEHTQTRVTLSSPSYGGRADGRYGLQVGVKTLAGQPYEGWVKPVYARTHRVGEPSVEDEVTRTMFYMDAPGRPQSGRMESDYAVGLAAVTLVSATVELLNGVQAVPGAESSRLHYAPQQPAAR
jgi:hypothetical protein